MSILGESPPIHSGPGACVRVRLGVNLRSRWNLWPPSRGGRVGTQTDSDTVKAIQSSQHGRAACEVGAPPGSEPDTCDYYYYYY